LNTAYLGLSYCPHKVLLSLRASYYSQKRTIDTCALWNLFGGKSFGGFAGAGFQIQKEKTWAGIRTE